MRAKARVKFSQSHRGSSIRLHRSQREESPSNLFNHADGASSLLNISLRHRGSGESQHSMNYCGRSYRD